MTTSPTALITTRFVLNGKAQSATAHPDTPLLWIIRDVAGLTGTKFGCGIGLCGACTVHLGRRAVRSCMTPLSAVEGVQVTTIEGLSTDGQHPLQKAWVQTQAPQCGYCQSGQIMQAAALIRRFPNPTDDDIDSVMNGNLCRCMAYVRIRQAIKIAAAEVQGALPHA
jgi:isoquinoline 1-oxidoreductase alpha subunit